MSKLKAIKPEKIEKRLKLFLYGQSGVGKTTAALQFPNAFIIDCERGCENYADTINKSNSVVFQSNDFQEIKSQLEALLTEKHSYKTLIIDPITIIYQSIQELWTRRFESEAMSNPKSDASKAAMADFGMRYWGKVKSDYKALQRIILKLDMNIIVTAHQKDIYSEGGTFKKIGIAPDSMKGDTYFFDNVFLMQQRGKERWAITEKERAEIGKNKFPEEFIWSYDNFCKYYGKEIIERETEAVKMATPAQVTKLTQLIEVVRIPAETIEKWLVKADVDIFSEFTEKQITSCIEFCEKKIKDLEGGKENGKI